MEKMLVCGVAADKNTARVSIVGLKDIPGIAFKVFNCMAKKNINVDMILQSIGRENTKDITFTVPTESLDDALEALEGYKDTLCFDHVSSKKEVAKVSVIGSGMATNPGVAAKMFEALFNADINIKMISTSEIRVTVLIDEADTELAVKVIHDAFRLKDI